MRFFRRGGLERSRPLVTALEEIAASHGCTPSQVALSWVVSVHGDSVVAIPGATTVEQARENAGALSLALTRPEASRLEELSRPFR